MKRSKIAVLHGALGSAVQFKPLQDLLQDQYEVKCFDLKGHGKRCDSLSFTMSTLADDVIALLYENDFQDAHIFGYSMGGYAALMAAMQKPGLIKSIFTLGTKFKWDRDTAENEASRLQPDELLEKVPAYIESLKSMHGPAWEKLMINTASMMRNLALFPLEEKDFKSLNLPVRLAVGDRDNMVTLDETARTMKLLPHGSLLVIPGTRHAIEKVNAERLSYEISYYIKEIG